MVLCDARTHDLRISCGFGRTGRRVRHSIGGNCATSIGSAYLIDEQTKAWTAKNQRQVFMPFVQNEQGRGLHPLPCCHGRNPGLQAGVPTFAPP